MDWHSWAALQTRKKLAELGVYVADERRLSDLERIAADNQRDLRDLLNQYEQAVTAEQLRDHRMALEFRIAITALGRALLVPDSVTPTTEEVLLAWFAGQTLPGAAAALKRIHIFERINQGNARQMLASFCRWLPGTGHQGLVAVLDFRPYERKKASRAQRDQEPLARIRAAHARNAPAEELRRLISEEGEAEPAVTYSDQAYRHMLALLRRFIDEIDGFERFCLLVLTSPAFYDSSSRRNYFDYNALQTRIGLEVRDARRANPAAALVHLGDADDA